MVDYEGTETPAGVSAASVQAALAADPAGAREAMDAQSSSVGVLDRFDREDRYANGSAITHLSTAPEEGPVWRKTEAATATGTLTLTGNAVAAETVTIGNKTYTWRASVAVTANEVLIGASASASLDNLIAAINGAAGSGTTYGSATVAHTQVTAAAGLGDTALVTSISREADAVSLAATEAMTNGSWTGMLTLTGLPVAAETVTVGAKIYTWRATVSTIANEVLIGATASASIDNLVAAINGIVGSGTQYGSLTSANINVYALPWTGDTMAVASKVAFGTAGVVGYGGAMTETMTNGSWSGITTLIGASPSSIDTTLRGLKPGANGLFYIGGSAATLGGKFAFGVEWTPVLSSFGAGVSGGMNVSFAPVEMISDAGGISPNGVVHINLNTSGVSFASIYPSTVLTCLNGITDGSNIPWFPGCTGISPNRRYQLLVEVDGDIVSVTLVGIGTLYFTHPDISTKVAATTHFWIEPNGELLGGTHYSTYAVLHRIWAQAREWQEGAATGQAGNASVLSTTTADLPARVRFLGGSVSPWASGNAPTVADNYFVATPQKMRADKGFWSRPFAGYADYPMLITQNIITTPLSNAATGVLTSVLNVGELPVSNVGDWMAWDFTGIFASNATTKRVQVFVATTGAVLADTGDILGTPSGGSWRARYKRVYLNGASHDTYGEISVTIGGVTTVYTGRLEYNNGAVASTYQMRLTGGATNDVRIHQGGFTAEIKPSP